MKTLHKDRLFLIKFRLHRQICNKLGIYITWVFIERQDAFNEENVTGHNCDFCDSPLSRFFLPATIHNFWLIFQPRLKCNYGPFFYFPHSTLFTAWIVLGFVIRNCKILVQLSPLFREISPPLKHFATSNSQNILVFQILKTFNSRDLSFKSRRKIFVTFLKFFSQDIFFSILSFLSWITGTNFQWHKTKNICSKKMMGLISLYILLEQFLAVLHIVYLFSIQWIFPNIFLIHSQFFRRFERNNYILTDSTILNIFFPPCELLYLRKIDWHFQTCNC